MNKQKLMKWIAAIGAAVALWLAPKPVPTPKPTPTPVVTPAPTIEVTATPTPEPDTCDLPPSDGTCTDNPKSEPLYRDAVRIAQDLAEPMFIVDGRVVDEEAYTGEVARFLRSAHYCAKNGLKDEVWVKRSNNFSEHYDLVVRDGTVWLKFAARCSPAKF